LQGCAEAGVCYPPQTHEFKVELPAGSVAAAKTQAAGEGDETGRIARALAHAGFFTNLFFFFLAGLGLALTPCVFPMIPILSGIIAGQGQHVSRGRGFALSAAYVLGMAVTYSAAGVAAGLTGTLISAALQNSWVLGGFALVFVVLSLSMFGFYDLQLPSSLQSKLSDEAGHLQGGRGIGVFLMGALSALIVGPCVAAPLAGALLYIGQTGDAVLGGAALFAMALGMGVPLLLVGLSAGTLLPRAGLWMEGVKKFFGVLLLGTAVWLVSPVIPVAAQMMAWAVLLIVPAIYLHALDPLPPTARGWQRFWKGCGVIMLLVGAALLIGVLAGNRDPLQPLGGLRGQGQAQAAEAPHLPFERVKTLGELEARVKAAGKPVMLDFYADWCVSCKEMERFTFADPAVRAKLAGFTLLQADVTANSDDDKALLQRFGLFGPPGILFFDAQGKEVKAVKVVGFQEPGEFLKSLARL
jgi:thiol:disulfide interchange protein DsbD